MLLLGFSVGNRDGQWVGTRLSYIKQTILNPILNKLY